MRFLPSRRYVWMGLTVWGLAAAAGWMALLYPWAVLLLAFLLLLSSFLVFLGLRPPIATSEQHLVVGRRAIPWGEIRQVNRTSWRSPLVVHLGLSDGRRVHVFYTGDAESGDELLRQICRSAPHAVIDGKPNSEVCEMKPSQFPKVRQSPPPRYRLLRPEDEEEVERLYQRLKAVGRLDSKSSTDEM